MRAVHLGVAPKLNTESCLSAILRSIARRGKPSTIISDNGTKVVRPERELAEYVAAWNKEGIEEDLIQRKIRWKFNPPQPLTLEEYGNGLGEVARKQCMQFWGTDQSPSTFFQQRCVLLSRH